MRALAALVVSLALIAPAPAEADSQIGTRTYLVAAQKGGLVAFRVERVEERPHGHYVPASGYVSLEVKVPGHAWARGSVLTNRPSATLSLIPRILPHPAHKQSSRGIWIL